MVNGVSQAVAAQFRPDIVLREKVKTTSQREIPEAFRPHAEGLAIVDQRDCTTTMSNRDCRCFSVTQRFAGHIVNERFVVRVLGSPKLDDFHSTLCNERGEVVGLEMLIALPGFKFSENLVDYQEPIR